MLLAVAEYNPEDCLHFRSVDALLTWAYQDRAHFMIREIERALDPRSVEFVRARYNREFNFQHLRMWVIGGLPTGIHKGRGVEKMILHYFGHSIGLKSLRRDLRCTTPAPLKLQTIIDYRGIANSRLDAIKEHAMGVLKTLCEERGWVG